MADLSELKPIIFVDLKKTDIRRVVKCLNSVGMACTNEQAEQLFKACAPLPDYDRHEYDTELLTRLMPHVRIDWDQATIKPDDALHKLAAEYESATTDSTRRWIELRMLLTTNGLDEHPEWWNHACCCDECRTAC